jgi:tetratricopeptide (TPR) repeat protein
MPVPNVGQEQVQPSEPLWLSSIAPIADPAVAAQVTASEKPEEDATVRVSAMPAERLGRQSTSPLPAGPVNDPAFIPTNPTPAPAPAIRMNVLLDSELETTMKRPAVRLQPIQQQVASRDHNGTAHAGRGRNSERSGQRQAESKGSVSYRERLVRGYQAQLIGDFDEAMQEYRLIIRNAPELLGEVVSNVRALLKLAPNYSAGYRVLGDAYMRQGEYLQAMESYNKALTMAKKAKG